MTARIQSIAAGVPGRSLLALVSCAALWPQYHSISLLIFGAALVATLQPDRRPIVFSFLAALIFLSQLLPQESAGGLGFKPLIFAVAWIGAVLAWSRIRALWRIGLWPLHIGVAAGLAGLACMNTGVMNIGALRPVAAAFALQQLAMALLWRTSYWMKWRAKSASSAPLVSRLFALIPFFGAGGVPIGKSPEYFARYEARKHSEAAAAQIEGTKLLLLALVYRFLLSLADQNPQAFLPTMAQLLADPELFPIGERWLGIYAELIRAVLEIAVFGHTAVGICCWMGYRIPRNTRSPLWSNSIFDFWARYYFYFKELLLDFFFFPVYLRLKRFSPVTRTVLAAFAAACIGNFYYHALLFSSVLMQVPGNPDAYLQWIGARLIYCVLLAAGLSVSMARSVRNPKLVRRRWIGILVSATFFALLHIWSFGAEPFTIAARWHALESLFSLGI